MIFFSIKSVHPSSVLFLVLFVPMHISIQRHTGAQLEEFRFWSADRKGSSRGNMFRGSARSMKQVQIYTVSAHTIEKNVGLLIYHIS